MKYVINDSLALGIPASQLVVGVPFYGRQYPTFGQSNSPLDRQLRTLGYPPGVNGR